MTDRLQLRLIDNEGQIGRSIADVTLGVDGLARYSGTDGGRDIARSVLESVARRPMVGSQGAAFRALAAEPYCNGKLGLGPASPIASARRARMLRILDYDPTQPRDDDGKFSKSPLSAAREVLVEQLKAVSMARDDHAFDPGGESDFRKPWINWQAKSADQNIYPQRTVEFNTTGEEDQETLLMDMAYDERQQWAQALGTSLMHEEGVPSENRLIASILLAGVRDGITLGDTSDIAERDRYIDWSGRDSETGNWLFEVGASDESINFELTPAEVRGLHASLVLSVLEDEAKE